MVITICLALIPITPFCISAAKVKEVPVAVQAQMIVKTASKYHYSPRSVNDTFSRCVYRSLLEMLDPYGTLFTEELVGRLEMNKDVIDYQIMQQKTAFLDTVTSMYTKQLKLADSLVKCFAKKDIDLTVNDTIWLGGITAYGKKSDLFKNWERWIKYMVLWSCQANTDSSGRTVMPSRDELRRITADVVTRETCRIQSRFNSPGGVRKWTELLYLKSIAMAFDPHSEYLPAVEKKEFETDLSKESGSFGIQVDFNMIGEIEIIDVMPGSPAWKSSKINEEDIILDLKKSNGKKLDLRCITLSDVYDFLSAIGREQTVFKIRKKNGKIITVSLKKEILDIEANTIRSFILEKDSKIAYVYLPSFYTDFSYSSYNSKGCANDMAKELIKLKKDGIDGLILDTRSNGGGSMKEAFRLAGIFIDYGALCITHDRGSEPEIIKDNARGTIYNGPLVVLVNSSSASASELFAAVLQDYNRAVIAGSKTYGKSTVQTILPVDAGKFDSLQHYKGEPPGFIKLTTGGFYRVNGTSHQKTGIIPDVELPEIFADKNSGESTYKGALELKNIKKKTYYYPLDSLPVKRLKDLSGERLMGNPVFSYIGKIGALIPGTDSRYPVPLAFSLFDRYIGQFEEIADSFPKQKPVFKTALPGYLKKNSMTGQEKSDNDLIMREIKEDIYINEAFNIISDLIRTGKEGK